MSGILGYVLPIHSAKCTTVCMSCPVVCHEPSLQCSEKCEVSQEILGGTFKCQELRQEVASAP